MVGTAPPTAIRLALACRPVYNMRSRKLFGQLASRYSLRSDPTLMNKAFVREPEFDGKAYCPQCGSLGAAVGEAALDYHVQPAIRTRLGDAAWYCGFAKCDVAYFDLFESSVSVDELASPVYPKHTEAPICACFGFTIDDLEADASDGTPSRIRELLAKSKSSDANCRVLAADGQCCMREIQRLYMARIGNQGHK